MPVKTIPVHDFGPDKYKSVWGRGGGGVGVGESGALYSDIYCIPVVLRTKGQDTTDATMRVYARQTHPDARRARHNYFFLRCSVARSYARDAP